MKHTPGPWKVAQDNKMKVLAAREDPVGDFIVAETSAWFTDTWSAEHNANLIAAAPELLEASELAKVTLNELAKQCREANFPGHARAAESAKFHLEQAIAKAEGSQ